MTGFTRLAATDGALPDGVEKEIPTVFVRAYEGGDLVRFHGYRVINRPYSVTQFMKTKAWADIKEEYVYIAETDHIMMHPLPNKALRGSPMAYVFGYMGPNPGHASIIQRVWPEGGPNGWKKVQPIGPSPVVINKQDLEAIAVDWRDISIALKTNPQADSQLGWVIEMWGYAIAAAKIGLRHQEFKDFQVEPGGNSVGSQLKAFETRYWLFHYTYQFEYMLDATPCIPWMIGEYSLDKRHFSNEYPPVPLPEPPKGANKAAFYLLRAFNEAMLGIPTWPVKQAPASEPQLQSLYGRRRLDWFSRHDNGFKTELRTMPLVKKLAGSRWQCKQAGADTTFSLALSDDGDVGGDKRGRWGSMNDPTLGSECPVYSCIFIDFSGRRSGPSGQQNAGVSPDADQLKLRNRNDGEAPTWTCSLKK